MTTPDRMRTINREITKQYIAMDPITLELIPQAEFKTDSGSTVMEDGTPRDPQTFKLITLQFTPRQGEPSITIDGHEHTIGAYLLGEYGATVGVGDYWIGEDGRRYQVIALMDGHGWETKAAVEIHGQ